MGEIVGVACASHSPGITGFPDRADGPQRAEVYAAYDTVRRRFAELAPDLIVAVSVEHFTNFFLSNLPAFAICTGSSFHGPATAEMARFLQVEEREYRGHAEFGAHLYSFALRSGFDPALVDGDFRFDENFCVPLELIEPTSTVPVVPIVVNGVNPPHPTLGRCYDFGAMIADAVAAAPPGLRVAVLGTGGLSHFVGMPESGTVDVAFDEDFLRRFGSGSRAELAAIPDADIDRAGNGAHEVRTWVVAAGAARSTFSVLAYQPVPAWLTGTAIAIAN